MAARPIHAQCRQCGQRMVLGEVVTVTAGRCPGCSRVLAPGYTELLLQDAQRAERLEGELVITLRRLAGLPGNLRLDPDAILAAAIAEVGWDELLAGDRDLVQTEAEHIDADTRRWRSRERGARLEQAPALSGRIRALAQRLRRHGDPLPPPGDDRAPATADPALRLRRAADGLDAAAHAVHTDARLADDRVRAALRTAREALQDQPTSPR